MREASEREFAFSDNDFKFITELVSKRTGIVLQERKRDMVYSRLARRLRALNIQNFADYCTLLTSDNPEEITNFVNAITTNLTGFFREGHHFEHLHHLITSKTGSDKTLRIWSAGCSTGQEPYSIAMTVLDALPNIAAWDVKILATDIDTNVLGKGAAGIYATKDAESISPAYLREYTTSQGDKLLMSDKLKRLIHFKQLNLLGAWPMKGPFDIIFCRNVVIYFDKPTQRDLFNRYATILKPAATLYIGHSENLSNVCDRFELVGRTIYKKIK